MATPFATVADLELRWRPLSTDEAVRAAVLLGDASDIVRESWPTVDDRILAGTLTASAAVRVVTGMVKRAMIAGDLAGIAQAQETTGPFQSSFSPVNPTGDLYLTSADRLVFDGRRSGRAFAVDLG